MALLQPPGGSSSEGHVSPPSPVAARGPGLSVTDRVRTTRSSFVLDSSERRSLLRLSLSLLAARRHCSPRREHARSRGGEEKAESRSYQTRAEMGLPTAAAPACCFPSTSSSSPRLLLLPLQPPPPQPPRRRRRLVSPGVCFGSPLPLHARFHWPHAVASSSMRRRGRRRRATAPPAAAAAGEATGDGGGSGPGAEDKVMEVSLLRGVPRCAFFFVLGSCARDLLRCLFIA